MKNIDKLEVVIRHNDERVVAGIPQIALYATAPTVSAALQLLEQKKGVLKEDMATAGIADGPHGLLLAATPMHHDRIGPFVLKSAIVAFFVLLSVAVAGALFVNRVEGVLKNIVGVDRIGGREFWTGIEQALEKAADPSNALSPERQKKVISHIHVLVERWRPFTAEIAPMLSPPTAARNDSTPAN